MKLKLTVSLVLIYLLSITAPALAADTTGTTLRLEQTEGTVTVENRSGKSVSVLEGMKLYSGYAVGTEAKSYAHISLDETKAVKLDASSKTEVRKSGKQLELHLISGELLCDVTEPLGKDETLNIRTSTMVTGIRGTAVFLRTLDNGASEIYVLDGTVTVSATDPVTGETREVTITAGQMAVSQLGTGGEGDAVNVLVHPFTEEDIPGYVAVEIANNEQLQVQIAEGGSGLNVTLISENAEELLQQAEEQQLQLLQQLEQALQDLDTGDVDQYFSSPLYDDVLSDVPAPIPAPTRTSITLDGNPTSENLIYALSNYDDVVMATSGTISLTNQAEVRAGCTLTIQSSKLYNMDELTNNGTIGILSGSELHNQNTGTLINNGTITIAGGGTFTNSGSFAGSGALFNDGTFSDSAVECCVFSGSSTLIYRGTLEGIFSEPVSPITNGGRLLLFAAAESGSLNINVPFTIDLNGNTLTLGSSSIAVTPDGSLTVTDTGSGGGGKITSTAKNPGGGTIASSGTLTVLGGEITNTGSDSQYIRAVCITGGTFHMSGGSIGSNYIGIYQSGGTVNVSGGTVSAEYAGICNEGGTSSISGGTVGGMQGGYVQTAGSGSLSGSAVVQINQADSWELSALSLTGGSFTMSGGTVYAASGGMGISTSISALAIEGGTISVTAPNSTGVLISGTQVTMSGGTIRVCFGDMDSGSIYGVKIYDGHFLLSGGTIHVSGSGAVGIGCTSVNQYEVTGGTITVENNGIADTGLC